jgi:hypothetical protein
VASCVSQFFWPAALQQLTGLLADGTCGDGDGALCGNDRSTARPLDGTRLISLVIRQAFCRSQSVIPKNSSKLKQQNRA